MADWQQDLNSLVVAALALLLTLVVIGRAWRRQTGDAVLGLALVLAVAVSIVLFIEINPANYPDVNSAYFAIRRRRCQRTQN